MAAGDRFSRFLHFLGQAFVRGPTDSVLEDPPTSHTSGLSESSFLASNQWPIDLYWVLESTESTIERFRWLYNCHISTSGLTGSDVGHRLSALFQF